MPAFVTHELFGTQVFGQLDEEIQELLELNAAPYFWGLQGPDLLFFRDAVLGRSVLPRYGGLMHREKTDELFWALGSYLNERKGSDEYEALAAYILGFVGHYCLDSEAHPYIYFKQVQKERVLDESFHRSIHSRIESDIDTTFYQLKRGRDVQNYRPAKRLWGSAWEYRVIARLYQFLLEEVYGVQVDPSEVERAFSEARRMVQLTLDRHGSLIRLVPAVEALANCPGRFSQHIRRRTVQEDVLNLNQEPWYHLSTPDKLDTRSFPQIFYTAAARAAKMMEQIYYSSQSGVPYEPKGLASFDNGSPEMSF